MFQAISACGSAVPHSFGFRFLRSASAKTENRRTEKYRAAAGKQRDCASALSGDSLRACPAVATAGQNSSMHQAAGTVE
jgi:hypothetical protein